MEPAEETDLGDSFIGHPGYMAKPPKPALCNLVSHRLRISPSLSKFPGGDVLGPLLASGGGMR